MTTFTPSERELAQWLKKTQADNLEKMDELYEDNMEDEAWLLTARRLQEKQESLFDDKLLEKLANLEHQQWWEWSYELAGKEKISLERRGRWQMFWGNYERIPDEYKKEDRRFAQKVIDLLKSHFLKAGEDK